MIKVATPISHLFENPQYAQAIIENSDCLECREHSLDLEFANEELFHSDLQPIHQIKDEDTSFLKEVVRKKPQLKLISFHVGSSCQNPLLVNNIYQIGGRKYSREELLDNARENFKCIKQAVAGIQIAVENNNYYPTEAYDYITDADFISQLVRENDIALLLDISHAHITAHNKGIDFSAYKSMLPLEEVVQFHICEYGVNPQGLAYDAHKCPKDRQWQEVKDIAGECRNLKYITVEIYEDVDELKGALKKAKEVVNELS